MVNPALPSTYAPSLIIHRLPAALDIERKQFRWGFDSRVWGCYFSAFIALETASIYLRDLTRKLQFLNTPMCLRAVY